MLSLFAAVMVVLGSCLAGYAEPVAADTAAPPGFPATVSADALPTIQVNGVVWSQVTVGNSVYATGKFSEVRPPGVPLGRWPTARADILQYNIATGALVSAFNHRLNAQGLVITATPDGSQIIVGGDFTTVDGKPRSHIASFSTKTGLLLPAFTPVILRTVRAITASPTTIYVGGDFTRVGRSVRHGLASFASKTHKLTLWHPAADGGSPRAMILSPNRRRLIVAGHFTSLAGRPGYGYGALDPNTGARQSWSSNFPIRDAGPHAAITSLSTDGTTVFGSGYVFGPGGNFEGRFAINPNTGALLWMNDCHGDTYSTFAINRVLYSVGHAHDCSTIGAFPERVPRTPHRALAETAYPTGHLTANTVRDYANFAGRPDATQLDWYPDLTIGTYTGEHQAAWSVTGNSRYIALGGEFLAVNGVPQQGLTRFAIRSIAPNSQGPLPQATLRPTAAIAGADSVALSWQSTWDRDNAQLDYTIFRNGVAINTITGQSRFWSLPTLSYTDAGLPPGSYTYQIQATDPLGNLTVGDVSRAIVIPAAS